MNFIIVYYRLYLNAVIVTVQLQRYLKSFRDVTELLLETCFNGIVLKDVLCSVQYFQKIFFRYFLNNKMPSLRFHTDMKVATIAEKKLKIRVAGYVFFFLQCSQTLYPIKSQRKHFIVYTYILKIGNVI